MNEVTNFNQLKQILIDITSANNITMQDLKEGDWSVDYRIDLQKDFTEELKKMQYGLDLYAAAMAQGDRLAASAALMDVRIATQALSVFFDCFTDDLIRVKRQDFDWPEFPEDYKIPAHYNYKGPE